MTKEELKAIQDEAIADLKDDFDVLSNSAYKDSLLLNATLSEKEIEEVKRYEFPSKVKRVLAQRVGYKCSCPTCGLTTIGPDDGNGVAVLGEAAHIVGAINSKLSPRSNPLMSPKDIVSLENGIWLCRNHHKLVDSKESEYSVELLKEWKRDAEKKQNVALEQIKPDTLQEYVFPNIFVDKGIYSSSFGTREWCLLAFVMTISFGGNNNKYRNSNSFESDEDGKCFTNNYMNWMSENSIRFETSGLPLPDCEYTRFNSKIRSIVNNLCGLVTIDDYGIYEGDLFEPFCDKLFGDDENALEKLIKRLSIK